MPKVNLTAEILDLEGEPLIIPGRENTKKTMTIRHACVQALTVADESDTGIQKFERFQLAQKISKEDAPNLKAEEISTIKAAVGKFFFPVIVGRVWNALESSD